ncbi:MAG: hypothetical protein LC104_05660 [Bacteroidales bacterium]|nr:hypothetical protein [Bacteroidales bacterium]
MRALVWCILGCGLSGLVGCGGQAKLAEFADLKPVKGTVTHKGKPVVGGVVVFQSEPDKPDFLVNGEVGSDGSYTLTTVRLNDRTGERKPGAPTGNYRITYTPVSGDQTVGKAAVPIVVPRLVTIDGREDVLNIDLSAK